MSTRSERNHGLQWAYLKASMGIGSWAFDLQREASVSSGQAASVIIDHKRLQCGEALAKLDQRAVTHPHPLTQTLCPRMYHPLAPTTQLLSSCTMAMGTDQAVLQRCGARQ